MPPATASELLDLVERSKLLPPDTLRVQRDRHPAAQPAADAAEALVREGALTPLQAKLLMRGRWRNFVVSGKYKLLDHLGTGGMGAVYLCEHTGMGRKVALKVLPTEKVNVPGALDRFKREARAAAAVDHPNVVRAFDLDADGPLHYLVMEYVEGVSLQRLVEAAGPLPAGRAVNYARQAAAGLAHAHATGLVHRDVKPANLLVDRSGTVKVLDLGLARFEAARPGDDLTKQHDAGFIFGSADYLSPEQASSVSDADARSDVYSLGCTLFFLLTGRPPFAGGTVTQKLMRHQTATPPDVSEGRPDVPRKLAAVVARMLAKEASDRPRTMAEVSRLLAPFAGPTAPPTEAELARATGGSGSAAAADSTATGRRAALTVQTPAVPAVDDPCRRRWWVMPAVAVSAAAGGALLAWTAWTIAG